MDKLAEVVDVNLSLYDKEHVERVLTNFFRTSGTAYDRILCSWTESDGVWTVRVYGQ